ncbi:hypothetical protein R84981_001895 [Carnimonas sp. R-84981]|uniref:hypothetical protein n=1 Tax=Carnimonas bestiolae TaxID=3402172 RepID=UPI003EDC0686
MELSFTFTEEKVTGTSVGDQKIKVEGRDNVLIRELRVAPSLAPRTTTQNEFKLLQHIVNYIGCLFIIECNSYVAGNSNCKVMYFK